MGQDATATLSEIEAARQRLQRDIDELDRRARPEHDLPEQAQRVAIAAGAGVVGLVAVWGLTRRGLRSRREHRHARLQAEALADVLEARDRDRRPTLDAVLPDDPEARDAAGGAVLLAGAALLGAVVARVVGRS